MHISRRRPCTYDTCYSAYYTECGYKWFLLFSQSVGYARLAAAAALAAAVATPAETAAAAKSPAATEAAAAAIEAESHSI